MHRARTTSSALSHGKYRFNLLVINQEIDTVDPINGKNFRKINNVTNYTKPNSFPFKETIGRGDSLQKYRSYGTIYGSKTVRSQESGEVFASSLPNCGKK